MTKSALVMGLLVLFCVPSLAFAEDRGAVTKIKELDSRISMILTDDRRKYIQCEEIKDIGRELDDLMVPVTDPEASSLYHQTKNRIRDLCP